MIQEPRAGRLTQVGLFLIAGQQDGERQQLPGTARSSATTSPVGHFREQILLYKPVIKIKQGLGKTVQSFPSTNILSGIRTFPVFVIYGVSYITRSGVVLTISMLVSLRPSPSEPFLVPAYTPGSRLHIPVPFKAKYTNLSRGFPGPAKEYLTLSMLNTLFIYV